MSNSRESVHDFVVALQAGDWPKANELVPNTMPLNKQLELTFLGRKGDTLVATMALSESVSTSVEGTVHGGILGEQPGREKVQVCRGAALLPTRL